MDETTTAALARVKAAAAAHADDYVDVDPADLAALTAPAAIRATKAGNALAAVAAGFKERRPGQVVSLHRAAHLAPLLKVYETAGPTEV